MYPEEHENEAVDLNPFGGTTYAEEVRKMGPRARPCATVALGETAMWGKVRTNRAPMSGCNRPVVAPGRPPVGASERVDPGKSRGLVREGDDAVRVVAIKGPHLGPCRSYGSPRVHADLRDEHGVGVWQKRVARLHFAQSGARARPITLRIDRCAYSYVCSRRGDCRDIVTLCP